MLLLLLLLLLLLAVEGLGSLTTDKGTHFCRLLEVAVQHLVET